jgi:hypothetical protein
MTSAMMDKWHLAQQLAWHFNRFLYLVRHVHGSHRFNWHLSNLLDLRKHRY